MPTRFLHSLPKISRYYQTRMYIDDFVSSGTKRFGLWIPPAIRTRPELALSEGTYTTHTITEFDIGRLDLIAYRYYEDVTLWWVICLFSGIRNPLTDMVIGETLIIPDKDIVTRAMSLKSGSL